MTPSSFPRQHRAQYFAKCDAAIESWRKRGPMPLNEVKRDINGNPISEKQSELKPEQTKPGSPSGKKSEEEKKDDESLKVADSHIESNENDKACHSGIWLFTDRENISHFFEPNFLPPYNTPEKRSLILDMLKEEWVEETLSWKSVKGQETESKSDEIPANEAKKEESTTPTASTKIEGEKQLEKDNDAVDNNAENQTVASTKSKGVKISIQAPQSEDEKTDPLVDTLDTLVGDIMSKDQVACCSPFSAQNDPSTFVDDRVDEIPDAK